jgi:hypothetical protein
MFTRLTAPVSNLLKGRPQQASGEKGVPELLEALAQVRARKAQLEQEEKEIIAATRARLRQQQELLEELKKQVHGCGIEVHEDGSTVTAPSAQLGS